jgi:hypothetical protein
VNSMWMFMILASLVFATQSMAQDAKLIEAAKKEGGKVVLYGSLETPVVDAVIAAFRRKTGLSAEYWRASTMSVMHHGR